MARRRGMKKHGMKGRHGKMAASPFMPPFPTKRAGAFRRRGGKSRD